MRKIAFCFLSATLAVFALAAGAAAQTKISGTIQCAKPDPQHIIPVSGIPEQSMAVEQYKCTWTKPMEIAGAKSKDGISTATEDIHGNTSRIHGYHVTTMDSGDAFRVSYFGTSTLKEGALESQKGTWMFVGGTAKLKGIKGKGTFDCKASGDGVSCEVEGDYSLPK